MEDNAAAYLIFVLSNNYSAASLAFTGSKMTHIPYLICVIFVIPDFRQDLVLNDSGKSSPLNPDSTSCTSAKQRNTELHNQGFMTEISRKFTKKMLWDWLLTLLMVKPRYYN
jgi:hypothetical protein